MSQPHGQYYHTAGAGGAAVGGVAGSAGAAGTGTVAGGPAVAASYATGSAGSYRAGGAGGCCVPGGLVATALNGRVVQFPAGGTVTNGALMAGAGATGCGTGCGNAVSCMAGEECGPGDGVMMSVGPGGGEWITETTYRYVGVGKGDVTFVTQKRKTYVGCVMCILLLLALLAFLIWLLIASLTTTTTMAAQIITTPAPIVKKTCTFWGDPHLVTFDGARPSFYGDGDYWIIKNQDVHIQGRYRGTKYTYGLAATQKVFIGGPFLEGHTIMIEPMENHGKISIDGESKCESIGSVCRIGHIATLVHDDKGELVDEAASQFDRHMVHIDLPKGIHMTVYRWTNYLDLKIESPQLAGGQDGSCGNYNGDASDDTTQAIFQRIGARVPDSELLFPDKPLLEFTTEEADMLNTCDPVKLDSAKILCDKELSGTSATRSEMQGCMFDECFGMNEHALRTAKTYASAKDKAAAGQMSSTA